MDARLQQTEASGDKRKPSFSPPSDSQRQMRRFVLCSPSSIVMRDFHAAPSAKLSAHCKYNREMRAPNNYTKSCSVAFENCGAAFEANLTLIQEMKLFRHSSPADDATPLAQEIGIEADNFLRYLQPHAARVTALSEEIAQLIPLGDEDLLALRLASLVHDTGLLAMRRDYIARNGELTHDERLDLARHAVVGEGEAARLGLTRGAQLLVRWHHERWDGSGYPDGLHGREIPLPARILRLAETFCALTDRRAWRAPHTPAEASAFLRNGAGLEFDPHVVHLFSQTRTHAALTSTLDHEITAPPMSGSLTSNNSRTTFMTNGSG
jgi:HD-GYP domain-containing protein (c-di-GMP phosphodiesterase class II)